MKSNTPFSQSPIKFQDTYTPQPTDGRYGESAGPSEEYRFGPPQNYHSPIPNKYSAEDVYSQQPRPKMSAPPNSSQQQPLAYKRNLQPLLVEDDDDPEFQRAQELLQKSKRAIEEIDPQLVTKSPQKELYYEGERRGNSQQRSPLNQQKKKSIPLG